MPRLDQSELRFVRCMIHDNDFIVGAEVRRQRIETAIEIVVAAKIYDEDCSGHRLNIIATVRETTMAFYLLMSNGV